MNDVMFSLKPVHVKSILEGRKSVELRRRGVNLESGTRMWIYSTLPRGCVELVATISAIETASPESIWRKFGADIAITREQFRQYVEDCESVSAITIECVRPLSPAVHLDDLRSECGSFHPPQFFTRIASDHPLLTALAARLVGRKRAKRQRSFRKSL